MRPKIRIIRKFEDNGKMYLPGEIYTATDYARRYVSRGDAEWLDGHEELPVIEKRRASIIILVKDALEYFKKCISSLIKYTDNFELIIVDNDSNEETKKYLRSIKVNDYTLITNQENKGVSYGWDQGIKIAKYNYICLLNSDTVLTEGWLNKLLRGFDYSDKIGMVGPSSNGGPTVKSRQIVGDIEFGKINEYAASIREDFIECPVVGFCFIVKKEVFNKIGVFDWQRYGIACNEDIDFIFRLLNAGYKSLWCKGSFVYHFGNRSMIEMGIDVSQIRKATQKILDKRKDDPNQFIENNVELGRVEVINEHHLKIGFVTLQNIETDKVASTRLRVEWPLAYMPSSFVTEDYEKLRKCDAVVFQSRHEIPDLEMAVKLKSDGVKLIWDFTDPHWLKQYDPHAIHPIFYKVAELADIVTLPTIEIERTFKEAFSKVPTAIVKDRLEVDLYKKFKVHKDHSDFKIVWFGSYGNLCSIDDLARSDLEKLGLEFNITFICVYDTGNKHKIKVKPFRNIKLDERTWTNEVTTQALLESDIAINPKYDGHWKSYKSNNKTITSWICGVPCIERNFYKDIKKYLLSSELRNQEGANKRQHVIENYNVKDTAKDWYDVAARLIDTQPVIRSIKKKSNSNIAVYTSICGGYDDLQENQFDTDNADFIAFLDKPVTSNVWKVKKVFHQFIEPSRQAKIFKVLPYQYLDHEYSIWMDGGFALKIDPGYLIDTYLKDADIALFKHHARDDIYEEYLADLKHLHRQNEPDYLFRIQIEKYEKEGFPKHSGLFECTVILRRHSEQVKRLCEMWWGEITAYTVCDQCSFMYCVKKSGIKVNTIPGNVWNNELFVHKPHNKKR